MIERESQILSGALYFSSKRVDFWNAIEQASSLVTAIEPVSSGWSRIIVAPKETWEANQEQSDLAPKYSYWIRRGSEGRFLLVSTNGDLLQPLFEALDVDYGIQTPTVRIPELVIELIDRPRKTNYSLGAMWARVEGFGQDFRTIILYGNDLGSASLFRDQIHPMIAPYRISLRKAQRIEVMSIGSRGEITFPYRDIEAFHEVDLALKTINELGGLDWNFEIR